MEIELKRIKAVQVLSEFATEGHKPLKVITNNFEVFVAKSGKSQSPPITLTNELLCSFFLEIWRIPTPQFALVEIDPDTIDIDLSATNPPYYYREVCFGSKYLSDAVELNLLVQATSVSDFQKLSNPNDLIWIALFDMWVENEDRKPSNPNLLLSNDGKRGKPRIYAIDHAYTFLTIHYDQLNPSWGVSQAINDSIFDSEAGKKLLETFSTNKVETFRKQYMEKVSKCKEMYVRIVKSFPPELGFTGCQAIFVANFLFDPDRLNEVFAKFVARL